MASDAGLQVTGCREDPSGSGDLIYRFFVCPAGQSTDEVRLELMQPEIDQGTEFTNRVVPAIQGYGSTMTAEMVSFTFPLLNGFQCVPGLPGVFFEVSLSSADGFTLVNELWLRNGNVVAGFSAIIACPPVSVEETSWGQVKSL